MRKIEITAYDLASRFTFIKEVPGVASNPQILAMLKLDDSWPQGDDVPWCSAFVNYVCWLLCLPRSRSLAARSWLGVGVPVVSLGQAEVGFDVVIIKRGGGDQPGPNVLDAPGHVGFFAGTDGHDVSILGGNQGDSVTIDHFSTDRILGIRRLYA